MWNDKYINVCCNLYVSICCMYICICMYLYVDICRPIYFCIYSLSLWYRQYHGYLATVVCILGIIANLLNIVVLTRKNMISSTNCILTGLAVSDGLTMVAYLPFALRFYVLYGTEPTPERNTLGAIR